MTMADWTFDPTFTVTNPNDSPDGNNPTCKIAKSLDTSPPLGNFPTGTTINGQSIATINQGKIIGWAKIDGFGSATAPNLDVLMRYINDSNYYRLAMGLDTSNNPVWAVLRRTAGVNTTVHGTTAFTGGIGGDNVFFKFRVTWWKAINRIWFLVELSTNGNVWVAQDVAFSDTISDHESANKIALAGSNSALGPATQNFWYDQWEIYRS